MNLEVWREAYERSMEQFKGKRFSCLYCGTEGEYGKDITAGLVDIGHWGFKEGDTYVASVEVKSWHCQDLQACQQRRRAQPC